MGTGLGTERGFETLTVESSTRTRGGLAWYRVCLTLVRPWAPFPASPKRRVSHVQNGQKGVWGREGFHVTGRRERPAVHRAGWNSVLRWVLDRI
jgi:hypothetical protein